MCNVSELRGIVCVMILLLLATLALAEHSPDHAHVVLGGPCYGEQYAISLPTTEDAHALYVTLDKDRWAMNALEFHGSLEVVTSGTQPKESSPGWCGP